LDHVQLAIPEGGEDDARAFYGGVLGMNEVEKPDELKPNGGLWFEQPGVQLHLGIEKTFVPALKAHVAFLVDLDAARDALSRVGAAFVQYDRVPGRRRAYTADPFGNRIELIADGDGFSQRR
jgi:catechol 2,3-dioxygenase-like lactoylglutathione lyase family enzyme